MFLLSLLKKRNSRAVLNSLAQEIASACRQDVWRQVADRCGGMSMNEMRGYVRARAGEPVRSRASERTRELAGLSLREVQSVVQMATNHLVHIVVHEHMGFAVDMHRKAA
jgi:hypothetical protein